MSVLRRLAAGFTSDSRTVVPSPNIWNWPQVYEIENRAQDVDGAIWAQLHDRVSLRGDIVDLGCGDGFHLPVLARWARSVLGVEPHPPLVAAARRRVSGVDSVRVATGRAQAIPVPESTVDVVHARTAYFFGPGCEPGLREVDRVLRPGGACVIVDLDGASAPYGPWLCADTAGYDPAVVEDFFARQQFDSSSVTTTWRFVTRADLESVLRIEFSAKVAHRAITEIRGVEFPVTYRVRIRRKPTGLITGV